MSVEQLPFLFFGEERGQALFLHCLLKLLLGETIPQERIIEDCRCAELVYDFQNPAGIDVAFVDIDSQEVPVDLNVGAQIGHDDLWVFFRIHSVNSVLILRPVQTTFWCVILTADPAFYHSAYSPSSQNLS